MDIKNSALITDSFKCPNPAFEASNMQLPYKVCIGRQITRSPYGLPLYEICADCKYGKEIKRHFKDYQPTDKSVKIDRKNATGTRQKKGESPYSNHYIGNDKDAKRTAPSAKKGEGNMSGVTPKKACIRCGKEYEPKSNVQKRCEPCREIWKTEKNINQKHTVEANPRVRPVLETDKKPVPINKQCSIKGCGKYAVKDRMCISHFKESLAEKSQEKISEPKKPHGVPHLDPVLKFAEQIIKKDNGKTACLGQLLYASELLDGQIESALDSGIVDTNILLNIRKRIGSVVSGSILPAEVTA